MQMVAFNASHSIIGLLILAALYLATAAVWPVLIVVGILQYFGMLPHPITL
jgi:hypothetical protein